MWLFWCPPREWFIHIRTRAQGFQIIPGSLLLLSKAPKFKRRTNGAVPLTFSHSATTVIFVLTPDYLLACTCTGSSRSPNTICMVSSCCLQRQPQRHNRPFQLPTVIYVLQLSSPSDGNNYWSTCSDSLFSAKSIAWFPASWNQSKKHLFHFWKSQQLHRQD